MNRHQWLQRLYTCCLVLLVTGCATTMEPTNQAITTIDENAGYRRFHDSVLIEKGDTTLLLAFSGGGTRAAAMSYGVMQELRDTTIVVEGNTTRSIRSINGVSGVTGCPENSLGS